MGSGQHNRPSGYLSSWFIARAPSKCHDHSSQLFALSDSFKSLGHGGMPESDSHLMVGSFRDTVARVGMFGRELAWGAY